MQQGGTGSAGLEGWVSEAGIVSGETIEAHKSRFLEWGGETDYVG
jgi:hypothetical protein